MKFLLDTNLLIRAEPTSPADLEHGSPVAVDLLRLVSEGRHQAYLHPASLEELRGDHNLTRRALRGILARKYPELPFPPTAPAALDTQLGRPAPGSHDAIDHLLLASVYRDAVDYLVTDDQKLLRKARQLNLGSRVVTAAHAIATLRGLFRIVPSPPPAVRRGIAHDLDENDPIFDTFKADYPTFSQWLQSCKRQHRLCWTVRGACESLAGVCIVKEEDSREHGLPGRLLKLCSLKVADNARGYRYGELLLKAVFSYAFDNSYDHTYVEVFPKYAELIDLLEAFGFSILPARTEKDELVLAKPLKYSSRDFDSLDAIGFHIRFGPRFLKAKDVFVVPIRPRYHEMLFPECCRQPALFPDSASPYGNSILKAYLCKAKARRLTPGSVLLFYESGGSSSVRCLGVVEDTLVSARPSELAHFVGQRTVYTLSEIEAMCSSHVLAILFRQASGVLAAPLLLRELIGAGGLNGPPQSITRLKGEALAWIRELIELSP